MGHKALLSQESLGIHRAPSPLVDQFQISFSTLRVLEHSELHREVSPLLSFVLHLPLGSLVPCS